MDPADGKELFRGAANDEQSDLNDHVQVEVPLGRALSIEVRDSERVIERTVTLHAPEELQSFVLETGTPLAIEAALSESDTAFVGSPDGARLRARLDEYFAAAPDVRAAFEFAADLDALLTHHPTAVRSLAWRAYIRSGTHASLREDFQASRVRYKELTSPYTLRAVGRMPKGGWPLFVAMHGGGGVPKEVNDSQWRHMQIYYRDQKQLEGYLYLALRAPNDVWNGFYDGYSLKLAEELIRQMVLCANVDSDRAFLMGYSHGGYGAFHQGLNLADRFAAVHASASAPTEGNLRGRNLRNTPFTFMIGEKDTMYERLVRCQSFARFMDEVRWRENGYPVRMELKLGFGHGGLPDRDKIQEMYAHVRNPVPRRLTWVLNGVTQQFSWLRVPETGRGEVNASVEANRVSLVADDLEKGAIDVYLDERLVDLSKPVEISVNSERSVCKLTPSIRTLCESLVERGDPQLAFTVRLELKPHRVRIGRL